MGSIAKKPWWEPAIELFLQLSGYIVAPLILAYFLGKYLDERLGTSPWMFLATLGASFIFSNIIIVKKSARAIRSIEESQK